MKIITTSNRQGEEILFRIITPYVIEFIYPKGMLRTSYKINYDDAYVHYIKGLKEGEVPIPIHEFSPYVYKWNKKSGYEHEELHDLVKSTEIITLIEPSGGPYIEKGMILNKVHPDLPEVQVNQIVFAANKCYIISTPF